MLSKGLERAIDIMAPVEGYVYIITCSGDIAFMNHALTIKLKLTGEAWRHFNIYRLREKGIIDNCLNERVLISGHQVSGWQRIMDGAGQYQNIYTVQVPVLGPEGSVKYSICVASDEEDTDEHFAKSISYAYLHSGFRYREVRKSPEIIYRSSKIGKLLAQIETIADTDTTVLLQGASGTGKEVFARHIHQVSNRRTKPMISINCAALPENLLESELFGYEKGAFTGALPNGKIGLIEAANNSTLFLDEINSLPLSVQGKLLRSLETKSVARIGGTNTSSINFRVIAAANANLEELVAARSFRADLYYRLAVIPITLPPLRERKEDIPILIEHFLMRYCLKYNRFKYFSIDTMEKLTNYNWPGNVRELKNYVERSVLMSNVDLGTCNDMPSWKGPTLECDQPPDTAGEFGRECDQEEKMSIRYDESKSLKEHLDAYEHTLILEVMQKYKTIARASKVLEISEATLSRRLSKQPNR